MSWVGINRNTERRVLLVFRRNPVNPQVAVVADIDSLPERYFEPFRQIIEGARDTTEELAFVLSRTRAPTGDRSLLDWLHHAGLLRSLPIDRVDLYDPFTRRRWRLMDSEFEVVSLPEGEEAPPSTGAATESAPAPAETAAVGDTPANTVPVDMSPDDDLRREVDELRQQMDEVRRILSALASAAGVAPSPPTADGED